VEQVVTTAATTSAKPKTSAKPTAKPKIAIGSSPTSITHIYCGDGDYKPQLTTIASQSATTSSSVTTSVSVHLAQLISLTANPRFGASLLRVTFGLGTTGVNITTWTLDFGDGQHTGGGGKPLASVVHSYAKKGIYLAYLVVSRQQQYGGVQYIVPRNGLAIQVK
jgi:PKD repeat protein